MLGLLLWGGYSTIAYLGVPVHGAVLLDNATKDVLKQQDCTNSFFLCGLQSLLPSIMFTIERAAPFLGYAIFSVLLFLSLWGASFLRTMRWQMVSIRMRPVSIILALLLFIWLLFTTLSLSEAGGISMRQIAEPSPLVYTDASASVLEELKANFNQLQQRGCLIEIGSYASGAKVYNMTVGCLQWSFVTRVLPVFLFVLLFLFELLVLGRMILRIFRFPALPLFAEIVLQAGVGACAGIAIIWALAAFHIAIAPVAWAIVLAIPLIGYRYVLYWLRIFISPGEEQEVRWFGVETLLLWLLLSYIALNFLTVIRPFPIGWDDLSSYLNRPRLMVSYGAFIHSMAPFQWEYLTSLGYLLFGYNSTFGATVSMIVNWTAGILALLTVAGFTQMFLGRNRGLLAALLFYSLPVIGHFSFADMKVDNAVFTMGALAVFSIFLALFPRAEQEQEEGISQITQLKWIALAGVFLGFDFAMKPTAVMVLMASLAILLGVTLHWSAFFGMVASITALYIWNGTIKIADVLQRMAGIEHASRLPAFLVMGSIGAVMLIIAMFLRPSRIRFALLSLLVICAAFGASISPWVYHNNFLRGRYIPTSLELGAPNTYSPVFVTSGTGVFQGDDHLRVLPLELRVDPSSPACTSTGGKEELDRYWGYRTDWTHYILLPWRTVNNLDSAGYYVTSSSFLFLFPLLLLLPYFWMRRGRWFLWLFAATSFLILEWIFLANGILWYGVGMFLGLAIGGEVIIARAPDAFSRTVAGVLIAIALFCSFGQRFWQYEFQRNLLEYPFGKVSASALQERTISHYDDIAASVIQRNSTMKDRPYLYRIGTFIPYFIPRNLEVIGISDHQLDFFNCLYAERDAALTLRRLQALGFNSVIFDTNTATIEKDINGSLHQKVNAFLDFINTPSSGVTAAVNDMEGGVAYILLP